MIVLIILIILVDNGPEALVLGVILEQRQLEIVVSLAAQIERFNNGHVVTFLWREQGLTWRHGLGLDIGTATSIDLGRLQQGRHRGGRVRHGQRRRPPVQIGGFLQRRQNVELFT